MTPEFFNVQPVDAALNMLFELWNPRQSSELIDVRDGLGRILAEPVMSPISLPTFRRSTMDGYAVVARDTFGASGALPAYLKIAGTINMGEASKLEITSGCSAEIHTGGMLPKGADAVVMIEQTHALGTNEIEVLQPVAPGENIIDIGEDVALGDEILPSGHRIRAQDIGGLLAVGMTRINVAETISVGILSCGDELVSPDVKPQNGQIRDINAHTLAALVRQAGAKPVLLGIASDELEDYQSLAQQGFERCDMLIMTAGSSVSTRDLTRSVIEHLGSPGILQHGLAVKPGKPTILALCDQKPVIGLPGNPVSAMLVARQIILPLIRYVLGERKHLPATIQAELTANIPSANGRNDTVPVRIFKQNGKQYAEPIFGKSNLIFTLIRADGLVSIPLDSNGLRHGASVDVVLFES